MTDLERARAEQASRSLRRFIREAWEQVEPVAQFIDNWHIGAICEHLEALTTGQIQKLVINVPPGHMKSLTCAVFWLSWWWVKEPWIRALHASYANELSGRDSRKTLSLLASPWYQQRYGDRFALTKQTEHRIENSRGGLRIASSVGGVGTGERAHVTVNDDLLRANDAHSEAARKSAIEHLRAMSTRGIVGYPYRELLIMQRLHEDDPTGYLLKADLGFEHLVLPAEYEPHRKCSTSIGFADPRTEEGQALWPEAFSKDDLQSQKKKLGSYGYAGQFQQRPTPVDGGIFKREWWNYHKVEPAKFLRIVQSWDTAFKKGQDNDNSVCSTWGVTESMWYLLDVWKGKLEFPELKRQAIALAAKWKPNTILMEDAASGQSLIQELRRETVLPIIAVRVDRDKIARAYAVTPLIESGRVSLPEESQWLADFLNELTVFPNGAHDDQVDSITQALDYLIHNPTTGILDFYAGLAANKRQPEDIPA